jgi:hypothetical protein
MDEEKRTGVTHAIPPGPLAPTEARVIGPAVDAMRETVRRLLAKLDIPRHYDFVLGIWPHADGRVEIHLSPEIFWRTVQRMGLAVTTTEHPYLLLDYRHAFTVDGFECLTFSAEPDLPPRVLTPGDALRLT